MSDPIQHHYVPKCYLGSFTEGDGFIWTYDKLGEKAFRTLPGGTAKTGDYNTLTTLEGDQDRKSMEDFFGVSETKYPRILSQIITGEPGFEIQIELVKFCALQMMRSPMTRDALSLISRTFFPHDETALTKLGVDANGARILEGARNGDKRLNNELSLRLSDGFLQEITKSLDNLNYMVLHLEGEGSLLTSDNPALLIPIKEGKEPKWRLDLNLPTRRRFLLYPLTPQIILFGDSVRKRKDEVFRFDSRTIKNAEVVARLINKIVSLFARRQVFSFSRSHLQQHAIQHFSNTTDTTKKYAELGNDLRKLVQMIYSQSTEFSLPRKV